MSQPTEADRLAIGCVDGNGHPNEYVTIDLPEPQVGFAGAHYCSLCGTDLTQIKTPED